MENPAKYAKVNKVEVMTLSAITFLKEGNQHKFTFIGKIIWQQDNGALLRRKM